MDNSVQDLIISAFIEIGAFSPGESMDAALANYGLEKLNEMLDSWNAEQELIFTTEFSTFTLVPNLQPHTIGPTGATFTVPVYRPTKLHGANLVLNNVTPNVNVPIHVRDKDWWLGQRIQQLATSYPTDVYYETDFPNGSLFFWPVPQTAFLVQLNFNTPVFSGSLALNSTLSGPPGYQRAITKSLALELWPGMNAGQQVDPVLADQARAARYVIRGLNSASPRIATGADGLPSGPGNRPSFNWRTGFDVGVK